MDSEFLKAKRALEIFLLRSQTAYQAAKAEDWMAFDEAMRWRNAAFQNFRSVDYLACKKKPDYLNQAECGELWQRIQEANQQLADELQRQKQRLSTKLTKISGNRSKIGKFYSGTNDPLGFQKSV